MRYTRYTRLCKQSRRNENCLLGSNEIYPKVTQSLSKLALQIAVCKAHRIRYLYFVYDSILLLSKGAIIHCSVVRFSKSHMSHYTAATHNLATRHIWASTHFPTHFPTRRLQQAPSKSWKAAGLAKRAFFVALLLPRRHRCCQTCVSYYPYAFSMIGIRCKHKIYFIKS